MLFIYYPKCSTCLKAKKFLDENGVQYEEQDIKLNPPTFEELKEYFKKSGLPVKKFVNTSGILYKEMKLKDKLSTMSDEEVLKLISSDGMLIKRPLFIGNDFVITGFKEEEYKNAIE